MCGVRDVGSEFRFQVSVVVVMELQCSIEVYANTFGFRALRL